MTDRRPQPLRVRALISVVAALTLTIGLGGPSSAESGQPTPLVQSAAASDLYFQAIVRISGDAHLQGTLRENGLIWNRVEGGTAEPVVPDQIVRQWMRDHLPIPGANSDSYVLTQSDVGTVVSLQVSGHDPELGWIAAESNTTATIDPRITGTEISGPSWSGLPFASQTVSIVDPQWAETGVKHTYEWRRARCGFTFTPPGPALPGKSMKILAEDIGNCFRVRVESTKDGYVPKVNNFAIGPFQDRILITGSPRVNYTLTANTGSTNRFQVERTYQWLRNDQIIVGATQRTFRVPNGYTGSRISVHIESFWPSSNIPLQTTTKTSSAVVDDRLIKVTANPGKRKASLRVDVTFNVKRLTHGTLLVKEGKKVLKRNVKVTKGVASIKLTNLRKGNHTFSVSFTPADKANKAAYMSTKKTVKVK